MVHDIYRLSSTQFHVVGLWACFVSIERQPQVARTIGTTKSFSFLWSPWLNNLFANITFDLLLRFLLKLLYSLSSIQHGALVFG